MVARPETSRLPRSLWLAERKGVCRKSEPQVIVWERRSVDRNAAPFHFLLEWASPLSAQFTKLGRRAEFRSPLQAWIQARWGICNSEFGHSPQLRQVRQGWTGGDYTSITSHSHAGLHGADSQDSEK